MEGLRYLLRPVAAIAARQDGWSRITPRNVGAYANEHIFCKDQLPNKAALHRRGRAPVNAVTGSEHRRGATLVGDRNEFPIPIGQRIYPPDWRQRAHRPLLPIGRSEQYVGTF